MPNFVVTGQTITEILSFNGVENSSILDLSHACLDHLPHVFGSLYHCAKCGL